MTFHDPIAWEQTLPVRPSSPAWQATIRALYGSPLSPEDAALFAELSGGREPPAGGADEFLAVVGRRGGKSETIACLATFEAIHGGHAIALAPGQLGLIVVISPLREQSQEILGYCRGLAALPQVRPHLDGEPVRDSIRFRSGIEIRVMTADAVALSGPTVVCAIRDELAKFPGDESVMPDRETDNSLRPALAPVLGAPRRRLIGITSAYLSEGVAFETDRDYFGRADAPVLVVRGSSAHFNPNLDAAWLARERQRVGETVFAREYLAEWQDAITDGWFGDSVIAQSVDPGRTTDAAEPDDEFTYYGAIDAAFRGDQFALAIAHREQETAPYTDEPSGPPIWVLDGCWSWRGTRAAPLSVEATVSETARIIRDFGAYAFADQLAFDPLRERYEVHGVRLHLATWSATSKPAWFRMVRDAMIDRHVSLPDDRPLIREFGSIQGRLLRSGGERIEGRGAKDDRVHAAVMVLSQCMLAAGDLRARDDLTIASSPSPRWGEGARPPGLWLGDRLDARRQGMPVVDGVVRNAHGDPVRDRFGRPILA